MTATPQDKDDESLELDYKPIRAIVPHQPTKVQVTKPAKVAKKAVVKKPVMDEYLMPPPIDELDEQIEQENALLGDLIGEIFVFYKLEISFLVSITTNFKPECALSPY